ncbi:MAG: DUF4363 family protein [Firmicutes bacterium]|nr:DUF4363 family protein [Bacillota bacterium]
MRALIVSALTLSLLIGCWLWFYHYSDASLHQMSSACQEKVLPAIEQGRWEQAYDTFGSQYQAWHRYKHWALFMLETDRINEIDTAFAKTLMYIKAKDLSNSSGELLALKESLLFLHENEAVTLANIL